jgi:hypothetical protein
MNKDLTRRIEKLERQLGVAECETKLRGLVRRLGGNEHNEQAYLRAVRGHERELGPALGEDGSITWEGFLRLRQLLPPSSPASPPESGEPVRLPKPDLPSPPTAPQREITVKPREGEREYERTHDRRENPTTEDC